jgi:hypothetical protein
VAVLTTAGAAGQESAYTPIAEPSCRTVAEGKQECPGIGGYRVFFVSSHERSWIEVEVPGGAVCTSERVVVYEAPLGNFPNVAGANVVEWRRRADGVPYALIFRVVAEPPDRLGERLSALYVFALHPDGMSFVGRAATNEEARRLSERREAARAVECAGTKGRPKG